MYLLYLLYNIYIVNRDGLEDHHADSQLLGSGSGDRHPHPQRLLQQVKAKYLAHDKWDPCK